MHLSDEVRKKVANFCNVDLDCVVQSEDLPSIYEVPVSMQDQGLDAAILRKMGMEVGPKPTLGPWRSFLDRQKRATETVHIGLVGKYDLQDAYKSIRESLSQAGTYNDHKTVITFINSEKITEENVAEKLAGQNGIVICPGFGQRGIEGKIIAAHYTRTHDIPTFGICLGMQMMVIELIPSSRTTCAAIPPSASTMGTTGRSKILMPCVISIVGRKREYASIPMDSCSLTRDGSRTSVMLSKDHIRPSKA